VSAILAGSGNLTKSTGSTVVLSGLNTYTGTTSVTAGTLQVNGTLACTTFSIVGGNLALGASNRLPSNAKVTIDNGGTFGISSFNQALSNLTLTNGTITGNGTLTSAFDYGLAAGAVGAVLAGNVNLNKTGAGTVTLSGANAYTGDTRLNAGTLALADAGSLGSGNLTFGAAGGTLDISSLGSNYTFAQSVTGNGTLNTGANTLILTGVIAPGNNGPGNISVTGNLRLSGNTNLQVGGNATSAFDQIAVAGGTLTFGGTLNIVTTYTPMYGETLQLFNAAAIAGNFTTINGLVLGPHLLWDASQLNINGTIVAVPESAALGMVFGLMSFAHILSRRRGRGIIRRSDQSRGQG
jgi:autotransporter-associated beta strand protein